MFKTIFLVHAIVFLILMCLCIGNSITHKEYLKRYIIPLLSGATLVILLYTLTVIITDVFWATLIDGLYFASLDWLLYMLLSFALVFDELQDQKPRKALPRYLTIALCSLDTASLAINVFTHHAFVLSATPSSGTMGQFYYWTTHFLLPYDIHLVFCYILTAAIIITLIYKYFRALQFYRRKYMIMFLAFVTVIIINAMYMALHWHFDYSILTYELVSILLWYQTFYGVPSEQRNSVISIISQNISSVIICYDNNGKTLYANSQANKLFNIQGHDTTPFDNYRTNILKNTLAANCDYYIDEDRFAIDGKEHKFSYEIKTIKDKKGRLIGSYIKLDDCTAEQELLDKEKYRATHDPLTGLYNRHGFMEKASEILSENDGIPRYFIVTNIVNFKLINELFGKHKGDEIIIKESEALSEISNNIVLTGRMTAERFAILMPKESFNLQYSEKEIMSLKKLTQDSNYVMRLYMGVYEISNTREDIPSMYDKACMAIDKSVKDYEQAVLFYDTALMENLKHEKNIVGEFPTALKNKEFKMFLQSQTDTNGNMVGAEALVRWIKPNNNMIPPGLFIPSLEKTGYIHELDEFIWEEAAKKLADWKSRGINDKHISVNISAKDFYYTDIYRKFTGLVDKYKIDAKNLKLEITETVLMHDVQTHIELLARLKEKGFFIEMDDFGSGYSSLNMLKDLNVDVVKIDMGFLRKTENEERSKTILEFMFEMTSKLKMHTICEGVETKEQVEALKKMGCELFQGYYYSKPISVEEFEAKYFMGAQPE